MAEWSAADRPAQDRGASCRLQLFCLTVITRAGRLNQGGLAREEGARQARRHGLPQRLVRVDDVDLGPKPRECRHDARNKAQTEKRPEGRGLDPAVDQDPLVLFVVDGVSRHRSGDDMNGMTSLHQLRPLHESLSLRAAGEWMEKAHYITNSHDGSCTFLRFLKCG